MCYWGLTEPVRYQPDERASFEQLVTRLDQYHFKLKRHAPNLPMARHHIDLIAMLSDKTRGNLSGEEERLLHQVLYDLRMRFIRAAEASKAS